MDRTDENTAVYQAEEEILAYVVSDDALEAAAIIKGGLPAGSYTLTYNQGNMCFCC